MKNRKEFICTVTFFICLFLIIMNGLSAMPGEDEKAMLINDLGLWYTQPATTWGEALPMGNGRIGALVFGGVEQERLILNESTLYSGGPYSYDSLPDLTRNIDILARLIRNGEYADADAYGDKYVTGRNVPCYQPLGDIVFQFGGTGESTDYVRELDLSEAVSKVHYQKGGTSFSREVFISHPDDAVIIHMQANQKGAINFRMTMESQHPTSKLMPSGEKEFIFTGQVPDFVLRRTLEWVEERGQEWRYPEIWDKDGNRIPGVSTVQYNGKGVKFEVRVRVLSCDGTVSADTQGLNVEKAKEVVLAVAVASSFNGFDKDPVTEGADPAARTSAVIAKVARKSYNQLLNNHLADYKNLFDRVSFHLPSNNEQLEQPIDVRKKNNANSIDPSLEALDFQFGRYLLISSSRPGGQPVNLQGLWNVDIVPPWGSDYTTNINTQMNYWPAEVTNLSECHETLFQFLKDVSVTGSKVASKMYNFPGWVLHHNTSLWRGAHVVDWQANVSFWPMAGGWLCQHLWEHYLYTLDTDFLRNTAYPLLKGSAGFYNAWLVSDENGHLLTPVSTSPENQFIYIDEHGQRTTAGMSMGCTLDMAIIRDVFRHTIEAAKLLHTDEGFSKELEDKLSRLLPYQIGSRGQLLEFSKEFIEGPPRHNTSPYYPLFPGNQFTMGKTPKLVEAEKVLIESRSGSRIGGGGWPAAWLAALWARLKDGDKALPYINGMINRTFPNMFSGRGTTFQIDANLGYPAAVAEMLLQSHEEEIELLPALPHVWASGSIHGLRARGGFEVGMDWQNEKLTQAFVKSSRDTSIVVCYGGKKQELAIKKGDTLYLNSDLTIKKD